MCQMARYMIDTIDDQFESVTAYKKETIDTNIKCDNKRAHLSIASLILSADCMMQTYEGNTALPPPCEEIVHQRKGGWFLTYKKVLSFVVLFVIIVIVAGLIGWNIGTMPKTRIYDPLALIEDEVEEGGDIIMVPISPFIHPSRYTLELMLPSDVNTTSKMKGRVIIEFRMDDTTNKLSLNARNITATRYKLSLLEENSARAKRRRRRRAEDDNKGSQDNAGTSFGMPHIFFIRQYLLSKLFSYLFGFKKK